MLMNIKYIVLLSLFFLCSCCNKEERTIKIDLKNKERSIQYSQFAQSVDYIRLKDDSCLISEIERIYIDEDTICLLDRKKGGVFVFDRAGELVSHINYYGKGPEEFGKISAFSIDPYLNHICIYDMTSMKIKKYSYDGKFIKSYDTDVYVWEFAVLQNEKNLFIHPFYARTVKYGIWMTDCQNNLLKDFPLNIPKDDQFIFHNIYFNRRGDEFFYYDRHHDQIFQLTEDTIQELYTFDLKQRLSDELRKKDPATFPWKDFAMMWNFSLSKDHLLMNYYYYEQENPYRWVLVDRNTKQVITSEHLVNDLDYIQSESKSIYYLSDRLWCREVPSDTPNNCELLLQMIHL